MAKTKNKTEVTPVMHYTVVLALIISLITTFFLGLLLTEALFGTGLAHFGNLSRQAKTQAIYKSYVNDMNNVAQAKPAPKSDAFSDLDVTPDVMNLLNRLDACFGKDLVENPSCNSMDLDKNGIVGFSDFGLLVQRYNKSP